MWQYLLSILLLCFCASCTLAPQPWVPAPEVTGDQLWRGTVRIDGDIVIAEGAVVRIAPGTEIVFLPPSAGRDRLVEHPHFAGSELIVHGRLIAEGEADAPIIFRYVDPLAAAGSWGAINLVKSAGSSFRHCRFMQADSAVHSQESTVTIACSTFSRNLVGVRFYGSAIAITDNHFITNRTAIRFHLGSPTITGNLLLGNDRALFVTAYPREYHIVDNAFLASSEAQVVLGEDVPDDMDLAGNFWGSNDPREIEKHFFDGQRSDYLGTVHFEPFLTAAPRDPETVCRP